MSQPNKNKIKIDPNADVDDSKRIGFRHQNKVTVKKAIDAPPRQTDANGKQPDIIFK